MPRVEPSPPPAPVPPSASRFAFRRVAYASQVDLPQPRSGEQVGRYTVLELLGRGGMGAVYKAYDPQLDRNVALKLLRRASRDGEAFWDQRLWREAQMLARLQHPHVVVVYDAGLTERGVFVAMELFDGQTLNSWLDERRRGVGEILAVFRAAGRGLAAVHEAGFVHRDFKPGNVLVGRDGSVRVLDFGIATLMDPQAEDQYRVRRREVARPRGVADWCASASSTMGSTEEGMVMGTPSFMAPEQFERGSAGPRSDQFAFCVCLHLALYGRSPVMGRTFEERCGYLAKGRVLDPAALLTGPRARQVPARVRRALLRGLSAQPSDRFDSMAALVAELEAGGPRWPALLAGLTLLAGFGAGAAVFGPRLELPVEAWPSRGEAPYQPVHEAAPPRLLDLRDALAPSFQHEADPSASGPR